MEENKKAFWTLIPHILQALGILVRIILMVFILGIFLEKDKLLVGFILPAKMGVHQLGFYGWTLIFVIFLFLLTSLFLPLGKDIPSRFVHAFASSLSLAFLWKLYPLYLWLAKNTEGIYPFNFRGLALQKLLGKEDKIKIYEESIQKFIANVPQEHRHRFREYFFQNSISPEMKEDLLQKTIFHMDLEEVARSFCGQLWKRFSIQIQEEEAQAKLLEETAKVTSRGTNLGSKVYGLVDSTFTLMANHWEVVLCASVFIFLLWRFPGILGFGKPDKSDALPQAAEKLNKSLQDLPLTKMGENLANQGKGQEILASQMETLTSKMTLLQKGANDGLEALARKISHLEGENKILRSLFLSRDNLPQLRETIVSIFPEIKDLHAIRDGAAWALKAQRDFGSLGKNIVDDPRIFNAPYLGSFFRHLDPSLGTASTSGAFFAGVGKTLKES